jgi:hypothetical protein
LLAVGGAAHSGAADPLASVFGNAKVLGIWHSWCSDIHNFIFTHKNKFLNL